MRSAVTVSKTCPTIVMPTGSAFRPLTLQPAQNSEQGFAELAPIEQDTILKSIHDGDKWAAHEIWDRMSIDRFWHLLVQDCVTAYYAHPWAWDEIGYGGPAYPRAYTRLEGGLPEPWEVDERRYDWEAPASSLSDAYEESGASSDTPAHGQGGTH